MLTILDLHPSDLHIAHGLAHTLSGNRSDKEDHRICAIDRYTLREQFFDTARHGRHRRSLPRNRSTNSGYALAIGEEGIGCE